MKILNLSLLLLPLCPVCLLGAGQSVKPVKENVKMLKVHSVRFFPAAADRKAWEKIRQNPKAEEFRREKIAEAEKLLGKDIPVLPASLYMDFQRKGLRKPWGKYYFDRRRNMETLVLAETFERKGRFMDEIVNHLWAVLDESTWCHSAHAGLSPQDPLPDFEVELIDLFSAETSARLSTVLQLLEPELTAVSPTLVKRMKRTVIERAIVPMEKDVNRFWWISGANNWTAWICSNLLHTANTVLADDPKRLTAYVAILQPCMDRYYARFKADGGCDEGANYWGHSVGKAMLYHLYLHAMTDGKDLIFKEEKYRRMCEFIADNWIGHKNIMTFADCPSRFSNFPGGCGFRTAKLLNSGKLLSFIFAFQKQTPIAQDATLIGTLSSLFWVGDIPETPRKDFASFYPDLQLLLIRSGKVHFGIIGGKNAGGHHHLDIGNFIIAVNGQEAVLDLGNTTYTKDTFSRKRFENPVLNSLYHNVPVFDGKSQGNGAEYAAKDVTCRQEGTKHHLSMDLTAAYPKEAGIQKCLRTCCFDTKTKTITVTDAWTAGKPVQYTMTLFTMKPLTECPLEIRSTLPMKTEEFKAADTAVIGNWGKVLWKTVCSAPKAASGTHTITFQVK